jgi:hypothetical protein
MKKCFLIVLLALVMRSSYGGYEAPKKELSSSKSFSRISFSANGTMWTAIKFKYNNTWSNYYSLGNIDYNSYSNYSEYVPAVSGSLPDELVIPSEIETSGEVLNRMEPAAFQYLSVKSVVVPENFVNISYGAFRGCANLTTISLPSTLIAIDAYAFSNCTSLSYITIPDSITSIGEGAFRGCANLTTIRLPSTLTAIDAYAFGNCTSLSCITIPDSVTSIGEGAFVGSKNLKSLKIQETVTFVAADAFANIDFDEFYVYGSPEGWNSAAFGSSSTIATFKTFRCPSEYLEAWLTYLAAASITPLKIETELSTVKVLSTLNCGGTLSFRNKQLVKGETTSITAMPNEGYIFLGWSSDVEGIGGSEPTLTFTVPERDEMLLIANFFPKALLTTLVNETLNATLDAKVDARIDAKIDGEKLLTAEQSAAKTSATINQKVAEGELITSDQLQEMALSEPVIEVKDGTATVGISVMKASTVDGEWENVELEEDSASVEANTVKVTVSADEKAAFYKFVVPEKQAAE